MFLAILLGLYSGIVNKSKATVTIGPIVYNDKHRQINFRVKMHFYDSRRGGQAFYHLH